MAPRRRGNLGTEVGAARVEAPFRPERAFAARPCFASTTRLMDRDFDARGGHMKEMTGAYLDRLASYVTGKDPISMQAATPRRVADLVRGVPETTLTSRHTSGRWSIQEIVAHLAEDELVSSWRYRQMLEHDTPVLTGFDQDLWATLGGYTWWRFEDALTLFRLLRENNLRLFAGLTPEQWARSGTHTERGPLTVRDLCRHMAAHDANHIEQIERALTDIDRRPSSDTNT